MGLDLTAVPDEVLRDELAGRYRDVVMTLRRPIDGQPENLRVLRTWKGDPHACMGMAFEMAGLVGGAVNETVGVPGNGEGR